MTAAQQAQRTEIELRKLLCVTYAGGAAYMDDGEAQDSRALPVIDFLRDTPAEIQNKMQQRSIKQAQAEAVPQEYSGVRCMCVLTGCRAGPGCPHYTSHCKAHIAHVAAAPQLKGGA